MSKRVTTLVSFDPPMKANAKEISNEKEYLKKILGLHTSLSKGDRKGGVIAHQ